MSSVQAAELSTGSPAFHAHGVAALTRLRLTGAYDKGDLSQVNRLTNIVLMHLRDDAPLTARRVLETDERAALMDPADLNALNIRVAAGLLAHGEARQALPLAEASLDAEAPETVWIAGLAAYGAGKYEKSATYFEQATEAQTDPWSLAAAAFWAARSSAQLGDHAQMVKYLSLAAAQKGTFYGMLATRAHDAYAVRSITFDNSAYPLPRFKPRDGFIVDPALLYAIMRQESRFDPEAESGAGAIGLMQIMPDTATEVTQRKSDWQEALFDPRVNLDIGQRYVKSLLDSDDVSQNLILMAAAYNGGPTQLARWRRENAEEDPLLFLETWPVGETRGFIEQVLANYWAYRTRLGQDTASMTQLAQGKWPLYVAPAATATVVADAR